MANLEKKNVCRPLLLAIQLIICLLVAFRVEGHLLLALFSLYFFYKYDILPYCHFKKFPQFLKSFSLFILVLFLTLLISKLLLGDFSEQAIVNQSRSFTIENNLREIFSICIISPILEELFFRFAFYRSLKHYLGFFLSILVTSFIFSVIHSNVLAMPALFILGFYLNFTFLRFQNILYPIALHILFNSIMLFFIMNK